MLNITIRNGCPVYIETRSLFEFLTLESTQAGLAGHTVRKRQNITELPLKTLNRKRLPDSIKKRLKDC